MTTLTGTTLYLKQVSTTFSTSTDNSTWTTVTAWPITLATANATLTFTTALTLNTNTSQYFIIGATGQTINGNYYTVGISVTGFRGLVKNGNYTYNASGNITPSAGFSNSTIKNVIVNILLGKISCVASTTSASSTKYGNGWLCHLYYGYGTTGHTLFNCTSRSGTINPIHWYNSSDVLSSTSIGTYLTGGCVAGVYANNVTAYNCFSTTTISAGGGIFGEGATNCSAVSCYSSGAISGGGGIFGANITNCSALNCYSSSNIASMGAGIFTTSTNSTATNCYSLGTISTGSYGILQTGVATNCYSTNGSTKWIDASANASLDNSANSWTDISLNSTSVAWKLSDFSYNLYDSYSGTDVTTKSATTTLPTAASTTNTWSIVSISVNSGTAVATYSGISINSSTGELSFSGLASGTYAVKVMQVNSGTSGYWFSTFTNTVGSSNTTAIITGTSTGSITETNAIQSVSGSLSISDPDAGEAAFVPRTDVSGNNQYGKFSIDASGSWSYSMNSPHDEFATGQYYMDSITVTSVDGTASQVITVTILGTNEVPIITGTSTGSLTETDVTQSITGSLSISNDPDSETTYFIPQTDVSGNNRYGKFSIDTSGNWSYTMNSPHNEFAAGQTYTDSIIVYSNDGSASQAITVTMTGINDGPVITSGMFGRTSASIGTSTAYTVTAEDPDIGATLTYSISGTDASLLNIDASSGAVSFKTTPSPRVYSFTVGVSDGSLSATQNVVLMVTSSSVANYPLITSNQSSITSSAIIYGDITVSNLNIASGVEIYLASGSTMTAQSGTFQGSLSGAGNLMKSGTGELTLSSSNTDFTGVLKVTGGTVKIQTADALGSGSVELGTSDSSGNATLKFDFSGPTSITNDIVASSTGENLVENTGLYTLTLSGNVTKDGTTLTLSGDIEVSGTIAGSSANSDVIVSGDNTVYTSSSTTDYNGPTTIQDGGTLTLESGVSIPNSDVTVESGGLLIIENTSMPTSVTANSVTLESNSIMNLNSGYLKTNSLTISSTSSGAYADINLIPGSSAIIETGDLTISTVLQINISDALTSGSYDLIQWTGTSVITGSIMVSYTGASNVSISGAFNSTSKKYTITVTAATSNTTYTVGGTISGNTTEVVLQLNGTESLTIASGQTGSSFTFSTGLTSGTAYTVTVYSYSSSTQSYVLNYSTGSISRSNISNVSLVFSTVTTPDGDVCFPANTLVLTNEGYIPIDKIDPSIHSIRNKKIIAVTKTVSADKHLVRIAKHSLGKNYPSKTVYSSRNHKVFYKGHMIKAKHLVERVENVTLSPYNGEPLYNILLEEHEKMQVNNLIVETLHPEHKVAKLYRILGMLSPAEQADLITIYNKYDREYKPNAKK